MENEYNQPVSDVLKERLGSYGAATQSVVQPLDEATMNYVSAPKVAREKYADVFDPFSREKLVSQYSGQQALPMLSLSSILGQMQGQRQWEQELAAKKASGSGSSFSLGNLLSLYNALKPTAGQEQTGVSATSGLNQVEILKSMLFGDTENPTKFINTTGKDWWQTPLLSDISSSARVYKASAREIYDAFMRTRTGAALNVQEEEFYQQYIPSRFDDVRTASQKLSILEDVFNKEAEIGRDPREILSGGVGMLGGSTNEALMNLLGGSYSSNEWEQIE